MLQQMTLVVPYYCAVQAYNKLSFSSQMPVLYGRHPISDRWD